MNDKKLLALSALLGIPGFALIGFEGYHGRISIVGLILFAIAMGIGFYRFGNDYQNHRNR